MKRRYGFTGLFVLLPVAILAVFGYLGYKQKERGEMALLEQKDIRTETAQVRRLMAALQDQPMTDKYIAEPRSEMEQTNYLETLRIQAKDAGVELELFLSQPPAIIPIDPDSDEELPISSVYQPVMSTVVVIGSYTETRDFAYTIMRADRLLNMSQVKWERVNNSDGIRLRLLVVRYITDILKEEPVEDEQTEDQSAEGDGSEPQV